MRRFNFRMLPLPRFQFWKGQTLRFFSQKEPNSQGEQEQINLYEYQLTTKYEAALSNYVSGNYEKTRYFLGEVKKDLILEGKQLTPEYIDMMRKTIKLNKSSDGLKYNVDLVNEIHEITERRSKGNFMEMQENVMCNILYLTNHHPQEAIQYVNKVKPLFPDMFTSIFQFYEGVSIIKEII